MTTEPLPPPCPTCNGRGVVWADLKAFRFGDGFRAFFDTPCLILYGEDGSVRHEIVCPHCDGAGKEQPK